MGRIPREKDWFSANEYAKYIGVAPCTIRKKAKQGKLTVAHEYIGNMLRIYPHKSEMVVRLPEDQIIRLISEISESIKMQRKT